MPAIRCCSTDGIASTTAPGTASPRLSCGARTRPLKPSAVRASGIWARSKKRPGQAPLAVNPAGQAKPINQANLAQPQLFPAEVDEDPAEVLRVLLHPVIQGLDVLALQKPQHVLLELT